MARIGNRADREHSGHYLAAVALVAVAVAGMAWFGQNRTLAAAAAALGLYVLHLFSIRFLLDNQKRQQRVLDAQWEILQRFIDTTDAQGEDTGDLVPAMPVDREAPERPRAKAEPVVRGEVVPPVESLGGRSGYAKVVEREGVLGTLSALAGMDEPGIAPEAASHLKSGERPARGPLSEVPVPRHFALGTVALVRDLLSPAEVARVLLEQRRQPGKKFGVLAVEMGLLDESQREELLLAQQEGLFTDAEMREARQRLREFRESAAHSMAGLD